MAGHAGTDASAGVSAGVSVDVGVDVGAGFESALPLREEASGWAGIGQTAPMASKAGFHAVPVPALAHMRYRVNSVPLKGLGPKGALGGPRGKRALDRHGVWPVGFASQASGTGSMALPGSPLLAKPAKHVKHTKSLSYKNLAFSCPATVTKLPSKTRKRASVSGRGAPASYPTPTLTPTPTPTPTPTQCVLRLKPESGTLEVVVPDSKSASRVLRLRPDGFSLDALPGRQGTVVLRLFGTEPGEESDGDPDHGDPDRGEDGQCDEEEEEEAAETESLALDFNDGYCLARIVFTLHLLKRDGSLRGIVHLLNVCAHGEGGAGCSARVPPGMAPFFDIHARELRTFFPSCLLDLLL